jgi:hypothetical protein
MNLTLYTLKLGWVFTKHGDGRDPVHPLQPRRGIRPRDGATAVSLGT